MKGLLPIKYVNAPTLKLESRVKRGVPRSILDAKVTLVEISIIQETLIDSE